MKVTKYEAKLAFKIIKFNKQTKIYKLSGLHKLMDNWVHKGINVD